MEKDRRKVIAFCDGGLGNRLNSLIGALILSDLINADSVIHWPENNWCGCKFEDLFNTEYEIKSDGVNKTTEDNMNNLFLIHENQTRFNPVNVYTHSKYSIDIICQSDLDIVYYHNSIPEYFTEEQVLLKLRTLKINDSIIAEVNKFIDDHKIDKSVYGILFRKTDYQSNPNINIDTSYVLKNIDPNYRYYICSDDKETECAFKNLSNVCVYPKTSYVEKYQPGGWNDQIVDCEGRMNNFNVNRPSKSVIEAFIALLIMSKTNIIVEFPSTFLHYAKRYSNTIVN